MLLLAGLGNPGPAHAGQRHNVGFMAADAIARRHGFSPWRKRFRGEVAEGQLGGVKVLLLKPQTFMNASGESVGEALRFHKLGTADLIVLYDELDLPPGRLKVKTGGGAGGHNGIRSIDAHCGKDYRRVRIGIGHPGHKDRVTGHVLGDFAKADAAWLETMLDAIAEHAPLLAAGDAAGFMNKMALATGGPADTPTPARARPSPAARSHIPQARPKPAASLPSSGPMADMLRRLLGKDQGRSE